MVVEPGPFQQPESKALERATKAAMAAARERVTGATVAKPRDQESQVGYGLAMRIPRILVASAAAALLAGFALTGTALASTPSAVSITSLPAKVTLKVGQKATLTLKTNVTTGTRWVIGAAPCCTKDNKAIAKVSKGVYTAPTTTLVGAPGTTTWTITALRPGTGNVIVVTRPAGVQNTMQDMEVGRVKVTVKP